MRTLRSLPIAILLAAAAAGVATVSSAGVLYKSVDRAGRVIFSDLPPEDAIAVQRITYPDNAMPVVAEASVPSLATAGDSDARIAQASAKVDMAERALALARRSVWAQNEGLTLTPPKRTEADKQRIEFYRREHLAARRELLKALRLRNQQPPRTDLAGTPPPVS